MDNNWVFLDLVKLRSECLYSDTETKFDIHRSTIFASSPYGGPVAIANPVHSDTVWEVTIKSCSGHTMSSFQVRNICAMHWTLCHRVFIVGENGVVLVYTPRGKRIYQFAIAKEIRVVETRTFFGNLGNSGLAVLTDKSFVFAINSVTEALTWKVPDIPRNETLTAWAVTLSLSAQTTIFFVYVSNFYVAVQGIAPQLLVTPWKINTGEYVDIVPYWDYTRLAFAHNSGVVQLVNSDLALLSTVGVPAVPSNTFSTSSNILWCGSSTIALKESPNSVRIVSISSKSHIFEYADEVRIESEMDGIKVFSSNEMVFISPVPDEMVDVLGIASAEPGAILFEASHKLEKGSPGVYDYLNLIRDLMEKAYQQCLMAAAHHFNPDLQKQLLRAASLGKSFLGRHDSSQFVDVCRLIRVLNSVRQRYIGIGLSFNQFVELERLPLIDRLIDMGHWPLAISLCEYLKIPTSDGFHRVLAHWAVSKIEMAKADKENGVECDYASLTQIIVDKFKSHPDVSFADVAMKAAESGLNEMAELLLEKEVRLDRQVEMLLKLKKVEKALGKAAKSQQPDLLHLVLSHLKRTQKKEIIDHLVLKLPQAMCLYQDYLQEEAPPHVLALYVQNDDFARQAVYLLDESEAVPWNPFDVKEKFDALSKAEKSLHNLKLDSCAQLLSEGVMLLRICEDLDVKPNFANVDRTSVRSVFIWAAGNGEDDVIEKLKKSFKLREKQCFLWKIEAYTQYKKWNHLEMLSASKKLPVGYLAFVEACSRYNEHQRCESYIAKLTAPEEIIESWLMIGKPVMAAEYAESKGLVGSIEKIYARYRSSKDIAPSIEMILNRCKKPVNKL